MRVRAFGRHHARRASPCTLGNLLSTRVCWASVQAAIEESVANMAEGLTVRHKCCCVSMFGLHACWGHVPSDAQCKCW